MESFSAFMESGLHTATSEGIGYHSDSLSRNLETTYYSADDEAVTDDHGDELCSDFWAGTEGLVVLAVALFCGVFARLVLRRTKIPYTVLLTCLGGLMGILHDVAREKPLYSNSALGLSSDAWIHINPHLMLFVFLPILVFEAALNCEWHIFKRLIWQILALALPGVILSTVLTACVFKFVLFRGAPHWDWNAALVAGSILSATDPVAVVALLKELGVSERLTTLMEGASSLSDGTTFVIFQVYWSQLQQGLSVCNIKGIDGAGEVTVNFIRLFVGGVVLGLVMGQVLQFCLRRCYNDMHTEVTLTFLAAFGTMLIAEATVLNLSGILSLVTLGLTMAAGGKFFLSSEAAHAMHIVWGILGHLANTVIFFVAGMIIAGPDVLGSSAFLDSFWRRFSKLLVLFILIQIIRALMIALLWPILSRGHYKFNVRQAAAMSYGGIRGAVGLCLALVVQETLSQYESPYGDEKQEASVHILGDELLFYISGVAILSLVVNGTTMKMVLTHLGLVGSAESAQRAYERVTFELAERVTKLLEKLKRGEAQDMNGVDWAAALAYIPARSEAAHQILNAAINEEIELTSKSDERNDASKTQGNSLTQMSSLSVEQTDLSELENPMRTKSMSAVEIDVSNASDHNLPRQQGGHFLKGIRLTTTLPSDFSDGFAGDKRDKCALDELLERVPRRLRGRILRDETKWPSVLSAEPGLQGSDGGKPKSDFDDDLFSMASRSSTEAAPTMRDRKADMVELRRRFGVALKSCYSRLHHEGHCEAASVSALVDGANRQIDDTEFDAKNKSVVIARVSLESTTGSISEVQDVRSPVDAFVDLKTPTEASSGRNARSQSSAGGSASGKPFDSWKHLLDAIGGGLPSFLSSSTFAVFLNTPVLRTGLKEYLAQQLGAVFNVVDGFVVGHERTLTHFLEEHARDVAADTTSADTTSADTASADTTSADATSAKNTSGFSVTELHFRSARSKSAPAASANSVGMEDEKTAKRVATLTFEVQMQVQLARNWLDALLRRFPEVALSIKTKKAARLLLSGERMFVERMGHEGVLEESEVKSLMVANAMSVKKLSTHPASLAIPSKTQRIRRHPLFKNITEEAAAALAKHCTEQYFDPNACLLKQYAPAKHWLLPVQGTFKVYQSTASLSPMSLPVNGHGSAAQDSRLSDAQLRATAAPALLAAEVVPGAVDVTSGTLHGLNANENSASDDDDDLTNVGTVFNAPLGLEDSLGAAGHLLGGGKCDGYRYSVHSPGYTHVLMVNAAATVELMNEHPSLRDAIWRIVAATMLLRNPQWVKDATQASAAMGASAVPGDWVMPPDVSARDLALSILRPSQSRRDRSRAGYLEIVARNPGLGLSSAQQGLGTSKHLKEGAAAVLLLDGTLRLNTSLASLLSLGDSRALSAATGGGAADASIAAGGAAEEVNLLSCAAAVTCGGAGEPSTLDGTAHISRLVPFADSSGMQKLQFAPQSVFLVFTRRDFVEAAVVSSAGPLHTNRLSMAFSSKTTESASMAPADMSKHGTSGTAAAAVLDANAPRKKTASFGSFKDGVPPNPSSHAKSAAAEASTMPDNGDAPRKKGVAFASQEESNEVPEGWTAHEDPASKKTYYVSASGETTWEKPKSSPAPPSEI